MQVEDRVVHFDFLVAGVISEGLVCPCLFLDYLGDNERYIVTVCFRTHFIYRNGRFAGTKTRIQHKVF